MTGHQPRAGSTDKDRPEGGGDDQTFLEPSGIGQFVAHDRCPRYIKQRIEPCEEASDRDWNEAFGLMNVGLLGHGQEFEAKQVEALAADATKVIGPALEDTSKDGVPDMDIDETWRGSARGRSQQLRAAVEEAADLSTPGADTPFILLYQTPLGGKLGAEDVWGEADVLVLAPNTSTQSTTGDQRPNGAPESGSDADVIARVIEIKSGREDQPAYRVQVAIYSALLEETLGEEPTPTLRIETSVLTQETAAEPGTTQHPLTLPTFRRAEWELIATRLLASDGAITDALADDLDELPFNLDQVCENCAYREACATRAVENPESSASLALLGLDGSIQAELADAGINNIKQLSELLPRPNKPHPTNDPPALTMAPAKRRALEEALSDPVHEVVLRAQALRSEIDPTYSSRTMPPAISGNDYVPLPADYLNGWSNIDGADRGELVHVALFVRPDSTIDRVAVLGAAVYADAHDEYHTIGETIAAVPNDPTLGATLERDLFERFTEHLFETIETVATELGEPDQTTIHLYTYTDHETESLVEGLDRHDDLENARALRNLISLHADGHTPADQDMLSAVQPIVNEHFALQYPNQGLFTVVEEFIPEMTLDVIDPLDARPDDPPLRSIFRTQFFNVNVPYLEDGDRIRLHLARGLLAEGPAADAVTAEGEEPTLAGFYPIRKRAGAQFPLEYLWTALPRQPGSATSKLHPSRVEEWNVDDDHSSLYRQEISQFYYRTANHEEAVKRRDLEYLAERLAYTLMRLVVAIPAKDAFYPKAPIDTTQLAEFDHGVSQLPEAARDYLRMEFGTKRETTQQLYRHSLRERTRTGRSIPIRCTEIELRDDGGLTITGQLAHDELFDDPATATQVASQARIRDGRGTGSGSWRVLTRLEDTHDDGVGPLDGEPLKDSEEGSSPRAVPFTEAEIGDPTDIQYSPPVLVESLDADAGTIRLSAFSHRFRRYGGEFRLDHCGWHSPEGSNLDDPGAAPTERDGYVAGRPPVWIEAGEVFMLDPMIDDFGAPKADQALKPENISANTLWQQLTATINTGRQQPAVGAPRDGVSEFLDRLDDSDACLSPNADQTPFIRAVERAIVPLQGPPGTGKTSGAIAPAMLARAYAHARNNRSFVGVVVAPSHKAVDAALTHVVDMLADWRASESALEDLGLVRVLPMAAPAVGDRPDANTDAVSVTYANYHSTAGASTLKELVPALGAGPRTPDSESAQWLLFSTPATLYRTMGVFAEHASAIDGTSAPAAMRHDAGLADVLCIDEASMLDIPQFLLAGSVLKPTGQTLLGGDDRQLATVSTVEWSETLRKPIEETQAYRSSLEYIRYLSETISKGVNNRSVSPERSLGPQTQLSAFGPDGLISVDTWGDGDD